MSREHGTLARRFAREPVRVVGAGPAGLACAILLARAGRKVVVHEARGAVGQRFHGDFQGLENWSDETDVLDELAEAGLQLGCSPIAVERGKVIDPHGHQHIVSSRRPLYYLVRRGNEPGTLDRDLLAQALELGVEIRFNERVSRLDGPAVLAGGPRRADAIAVGYLFETDMPDGDWLALSDEIAPYGYAYLLVHDGRGTLATCLFTGFKFQNLYLDRTAQFFGLHAGLRMASARRFGGYVNFRLPRRAIQGGNPVLGEHAGFQDALAGFGLRYALRSAFFASRAILGDEDYERAWRRQLLPLMRAGVVNRFLFNLLGEWGRARAVRHLAAGDACQRLGAQYRPRLRTTLLFPFARALYRRPLRDASCDHAECHCVWCEHGLEAQAIGPC